MRDEGDGFLRSIVDSDSEALFRRSIWQQAAKVVARHCDRALGDLWITPKDVDALVGEIDFPVTNFSMADGSNPLARERYAPAGLVDRSRVFQLHSAGATIILRAAQRWSGKLRHLCTRLEWDFGFPTQANVYITPSGRQSTPPHWDTHDLFILQVMGRKRWKLFHSEYSLPLEWQRFSDREYEVGPLASDLLLNEGDVFYVPRGTIHEPVADSYSIHVSLGVLVSRWTDLMHRLIDALAVRQPELRGAIGLEPGQWRASVREAAEEVKRLVDLVAGADGIVEQAVTQHLAELLANHTEDRTGQLLGSGVPTPLVSTTRMRRVRSSLVWLVEAEERLEVRWRGGAITVPSAFGPFLEEAVSGEEFVLGQARSGGSIDERVAVCESLLNQGLLEVVQAGGKNASFRRAETVKIG